MSKKSNKQTDNEKSNHQPEVEKITDVETVIEQHNVFEEEKFPPISATVNLTPADEVNVTIENISEPEKIVEFNPEQKTEAANVIPVNIESVKTSKPVAGVIHELALQSKSESPNESKKDTTKIQIVDLAKKTESNSGKKRGIKSFEQNLDKAFDSLIYLGSGLIAVTSVTSKALANLGNQLIKK